MRVLIRADASADIGHGHVMRCLALAEALRAHGAHIQFVCRQLPGHAGAAITAAGHALHWLPAACRSGEEDALACTERLANPPAVDWLVVDHYGLDASWAAGVQARAPHLHLLAIDDLANRVLQADLLLDQNWHEAPAQRYQQLLPAHAQTLFGSHYALLRAEFAAARAKLAPRDGEVRRVLLCFGGGDAPNAGAACVDHLQGALGASHALQYTLVVGGGSPHIPALRAWAEAKPALELVVDAQDMAERMATTDLFIGAGGSMLWECACLGLPAITLPIASNQHLLCARLAAAAEGIYLGPFGADSLAALPTAVSALMRDPARMRAMSAALAARCDGLGAQRVAAALYRITAHA